MAAIVIICVLGVAFFVVLGAFVLIWQPPPVNGIIGSPPGDNKR